MHCSIIQCCLRGSSIHVYSNHHGNGICDPGTRGIKWDRVRASCMQSAGSASGNLQFISPKMKSLQLLLALVFFFAVEARLLPIEQQFRESGKHQRTTNNAICSTLNCETDCDVANVDIA